MKVLIIGLGSIGRRHARYLATTDCELYLYDPFLTDAQRDEIEGELQFSTSARWVASIESGLLLDPTHALVCTPPLLHYHDARLCLEAGLRTFVEKPLGVSYQQGLLLVEEASRRGITLACGYMLRALDMLQLIRRAAQGRATRHATFYCHWNSPPTSYAWPGILEETSHELDLGCWFFGPAKAVIKSHVNEESAYLVVEHERCPVVKYRLSHNLRPYERGLDLIGDTFSCSASYTATDIQAECYEKELAAFLQGVPFCPGAEALESLRLLEVAREAVKEPA